LLRVNVKADEITDLIITHPHFDHIGGIQLFSKATVWMQKNDFLYFVGDAWQKGGNHNALDKKDVRNIIEVNLEGRLRLVNGDSVEIIPGIEAFTGSKHSFENQYLLINAHTDKVLLASDACWFYYNLDRLLSVPLVMDANAYINQLKRMKTLISDPELIIPGHDRLVLSKFPQVAEHVVKIR
jgi:glyoxylase-like metal-dependent hydrolase (beta-lactamase superfamily II)